ncbi:SRPBCC family protein [Nocardioides sp.]|uniref:SRPBCC family protein n=1 Tax=Nocardioides sp. TaxID=35761 RepID=UPI002D80262C|nr:SRPBCC family protein [Nocardioides sp.]HET8960263.1 SRPBCC family protein [Nocardioides sp.]
MADTKNSGIDELKTSFQDVVKALGDKAMSSVGGRVSDMTDKLTDIADGGPIGKAAGEGAKAAADGDSPVGGALKGGLSGLKDKAKDIIPGMSGGGGGGGKATKSTNIVETIDVGVPVSVAYNAWTEYHKWPDFMKKVESAKQEEDEPTVSMKAQIVWSHRSWDATIKHQVPDETILWRSKGAKGHVDGCVTFHEIAPRLTRILVVLEYYPQGLFEKTGNIWEAQGRRARAEIRHFRRHVMMNTLLEPEEVEGWRGEIHDEEVTRSHDEVVAEEEQEEQDEAADGEYDDGEPEDEYEDGEPDDEEPEDEYDDEEPEEEEPRRPRKKSTSRKGR